MSPDRLAQVNTLLRGSVTIPDQLFLKQVCSLSAQSGGTTGEPEQWPLMGQFGQCPLLAPSGRCPQKVFEDVRVCVCVCVCVCVRVCVRVRVRVPVYSTGIAQNELMWLCRHSA